jgi:hypothetical protein
MRSRTLLGASLLLLATSACGLAVVGSAVGADDAGDAGNEASATQQPDGALGGDAAADTVVDASPPVEDCLNGVDDDHNGLVDCADPACQAGYACIPAPTGAFDAVTTYAVSPTDAGTLPSCDDKTPAKLYYGGPAANPGVTCSPCSCGAPTGACVGDSTVECFVRNDCNNPSPLGTFTTGPTCTMQKKIGGGPNGCKASTPTYQGGTCAPSGGTPSKDPLFAQAFALCEAPLGPNPGGGGGCDAGYVCVNKSSDAGTAAACLRPLEAGVDCPTEWSAKTTLYPAAGVTDSRGCTTCSCGPDVGGSCSGGSLYLYTDNACKAGTVSFAMGGACSNGANIGGVVQNSFSSLYDGVTVKGGTCAKDGGAPIGTTAPGTPESFCCRH